MDTKLTLKLDQGVIALAKQYAKDHNISLSSLIENYLEALTTDKDPSTDSGQGKETKITPLVKSLTGVITLDTEADYKKSYADYLGEKYN